MKKWLFDILIVVFFVLMVSQANATHVMGGELTYRYVGGTQYEFTLTLYRNCAPGAWVAPNTARIRIKDTLGNTISNPNLPRISFQNITDSGAFDPCITIPPNVCVEEYIYTGIINLPAVPPGGYIITWSLRNRNFAIANITVPGTVDMILYERIPDPAIAVNNSSPVFPFPPTFICVNQQLNFNQAAIDIDGDSLVYKLYWPYGAPNGSYGNSNNFDPNIVNGNPIIPNVTWVPPYDENDPMGGVPLTIDQNGVIRATPNLIGQFVVGIKVCEYRNGVLIAEHLRDFQFNVVDCQQVLARITAGFGAIIKCGNEVEFPNLSIGATGYYWDFGDLTTTNDTSTQQNPTYVYPGPGTYSVMLIAEPGQTCADTSTATLNLFDNLLPAFSTTTVCRGFATRFTDQSTTTDASIIVLRQWDFGGGNNSTLEDPTFTFDSAGRFPVMLIITSSQGCRDTIVDTVEVQMRPFAAFDTDTLQGCEGMTVFFTNTTINGDQYLWDFGNGNISNDTSTNLSEVYNIVGVDSVTLIATNTVTGCVDTATVNITVNGFPQSIYSLSQDTGCNPLALVFSDSSSFADSLIWDLGNGIILTDSTPPIVTYTNTGVVDSIYSITLITISDFGCKSDTTVRNIVVKPSPLPSNVTDDTTCYFEPQLITGITQTPNAIYEWIPGTGLSDSTIFNPTVSIASSQTYLLKITTFGNCIDSLTKTVVVYPVTIANTGLDTVICFGLSVQLNATGGINYLWTPAVGLNADNIADPIATPAVPTIYRVEVTDTNGCTQPDSIFVNVLYPEVDAGVDAFISKGDNHQLVATANPSASYAWTPATALSCTDCKAPIATPDVTTDYVVTITLPDGCINSDTVRITVYDMIINVPSAFTPNGDGRNDIIYAEGRDITKVIFRIFDRLGIMVFETNNINVGWDGKYKGKALDIDTYVYYVIAESPLGIEVKKKGNISLLK